MVQKLTKEENEKMHQIRSNFPIFSNIKGLVYLDSAATTQKPSQVIDAIKEYYSKENSNIHRGMYALSEKSTQIYEESRRIVADFLNSDIDEIIFTKNATESLNFVAKFCEEDITEGDEILVSISEHHANLIPWQELSKRKKATLKKIKLTNNFLIDGSDLRNKINKKTKIVALNHVSNVTGLINDVQTLVKEIKQIKKDIIVVIDGSQSAPHLDIDVKKINCDFFCFSGHKVMGPQGTGVLFGKSKILEGKKPVLFGGDIIEDVTFNKARYTKSPQKFEAGTPNVAGNKALSEGIKFLGKIKKDVKQIENKLFTYLLEELKKIKEVKIIGKENREELRIPLVSFEIENIHPHDIASYLAEKNIAIRSGMHCAYPLHRSMGSKSTSRISLYYYNTQEDVDELLKSIREIIKIYK